MAPRGLCYYKVLGIPRNADDVEIKRAFRRLALKHHPDVDASETSTAEFARAAEAYDVLSNPKTKGSYDLYGEEALKASSEAGGAGYAFDAQRGPAAVFARFFGTANPYEALASLSAHFEKLATQAQPQPGKQQEYELVVPLEEIFTGCVKVVQHSRRSAGQDGEVAVEPRRLTVEVKPGLLDGTRFVFQGEGDSAPGQPAGAVVLVLSSAPHPRFSRRLSDLVARVQLPLLNALTGGAVRIDTLDGRVLSVPLDEVVTPGLSMRVAGEGMPVPGSPGVRGDLVLEVELVFPARLSEAQKALVKAGLLLPPKPGVAQAKALRALEAAFRDPVHGWSTGVVRSEGGEGAAS